MTKDNTLHARMTARYLELTRQNMTHEEAEQVMISEFGQDTVLRWMREVSERAAAYS